MPPGTSGDIGRSSGRVLSASFSVSSVHGLPTSAARVFGHVTVLKLMPPNPNEMSATCGTLSIMSNLQRMPAVTMAMSSSRLCDCLNSRTYSPFSVNGKMTDRRTSSGLSAVDRYPWKNSLAGTRLVPASRDSSSNTAPHAIHSGLRSEIGEAVHTLPPTLDTFLTCGPANQRSCSLIATSPLVRTAPSSFVSDSHVLSKVVSVTLAPMTKREESGDKETSVSSGTCVGATMTGYRAFLNLTSTPTSVLPHTSLAAGCAFLSASNPARVIGLCHDATAPGIVRAAGIRRLSSGGKMGSRTAVTGSSSPAPRALAAGVEPQPLVHG